MDWSALGRTMQAAADHLSALGCEVDVSKIRVRSADEAELRRAIELENIASFGESWFEFLRVMELAAGRDVPSDAARYSAAQHERMPITRGLRYLPGTNQLLVEPQLVLSTREYAYGMVRELYRAYDDQQSDVREREAQLGPTSEARLMERAWSGAHAELAAHRALEWPLDSTPTPWEERSGSAALHLRAALGWLAENGKAQLPQTSEQLLHRSVKLAELPTGIALPTLDVADLEILRDDQLGEAGLRFLMSELGVEALSAMRAGLGWDGDRFVLRIGKDGLRVLQARVVFDREVDAEQFEQALRTVWKGNLTRRGLGVDLVWSNQADLAQRAQAALAALSMPTGIVESKARSTEQLEARLFAQQPRVEAGRWLLPEQALSVAVKEGWSQHFEGNQALLLHSKAKARLSVQLIPLEQSIDRAALRKALETTLQQHAGVKEARIFDTRVAERDALRVEYQRVDNTGSWQHIDLQILAERGKLSIALRMPADADEAWRVACDALLDSLRFEVAR